ncbi:MAG: hypothetical protein P4L90_09920 [Rhodopila sp.]|nr:hypothetical protein [Rhodopila sp.]
MDMVESSRSKQGPTVGVLYFTVTGRTVRRHQPFIHTLPPKWKSRRDRPTGFHLEEEMTREHLNFLAPMLVIVIIKVKIIIKKR